MLMSCDLHNFAVYKVEDELVLRIADIKDKLLYDMVAVDVFYEVKQIWC